MAGRKKKSIIERTKSKYWYFEVKSRTDLSDSMLDVLFAEDLNGNKYSSADRPRIFESIRKNGTAPSNGTHRLRNFNLIDKVDAHQDFSGTKKVYTSPFWDLLELDPSDLIKNNKIIDACLERLNLSRVHCSHEHFWKFWNCPQNQSERMGLSNDNISNFEHTFHKAIQEIPDSLDILALIGALYRECFLTYRLKNAVVLSNYFEKISEAILLISQNQIGKLVWSIATNRIIHGNLEDNFSTNIDEIFLKIQPKSYAVIVNKENPVFIELMSVDSKS